MRLPLALLVTLIATAPVAAQVVPFPHRTPALDRHRFEMERLRQGAEQRETLARQQTLSARLTMLEIQAARRPEPYLPETARSTASRPLATVEAERRARETATTRRETIVGGATEIDAWLDRRPD